MSTHEQNYASNEATKGFYVCLMHICYGVCLGMVQTVILETKHLKADNTFSVVDDWFCVTFTKI